MCCCFFPGHVGQEFISPACLRVSQRKEKKKRWLLKQPILLLTCLLPTEHVISHHNSGLLLQIQRSAWPVLPEHSDGYQTRDGWHTTTTLTAFPLGFFFFFFEREWIPHKNVKSVMHATGGKNCNSGADMHLFVCLAHWQSLSLLRSVNKKTWSECAAATPVSVFPPKASLGFLSLMHGPRGDEYFWKLFLCLLPFCSVLGHVNTHF